MFCLDLWLQRLTFFQVCCPVCKKGKTSIAIKFSPPNKKIGFLYCFCKRKKIRNKSCTVGNMFYFMIKYILLMTLVLFTSTWTFFSILNIYNFHDIYNIIYLYIYIFKASKQLILVRKSIQCNNFLYRLS